MGHCVCRTVIDGIRFVCPETGIEGGFAAITAPVRLQYFNGAKYIWRKHDSHLLQFHLFSLFLYMKATMNTEQCEYCGV